MSRLFGVVAGTLVGAVAGLVAGIMVAPRPGAETRAQVAQNANATWGTVVDMAAHEMKVAAEKGAAAVDDAAARTDELSEKVKAARQRMEQIRANLANQTRANVSIPAEDVRVEDVPPQEA